MTYPATIIYLIGYPGTGKYTIGKEICRASSHFRLVDNHLINNPVFSLIHTDGKTPLPSRIWDNVGKIWDAVMDTMIYISPPDYSFVLTNALFETDKEHAWFDEISALAAKRQSRFLPVLLTISPEEHVRRINTPERQARFKETDQTAPARYAAADNLIKLSHPDLITLDVTCLSPSDAAARILGHLA